MSALNKSIVEEAAIEWFGKLGYAVGHEPHLAISESETGRHCHWHFNYETVDCYSGVKLDDGSADTPVRNSTICGEAAKDSKMRTRVSALLSLKPEHYP